MFQLSTPPDCERILLRVFQQLTMENDPRTGLPFQLPVK
jgi:hypothetical protein